jgi:excisionase family DNA binding protein
VSDPRAAPEAADLRYLTVLDVETRVAAISGELATLLGYDAGDLIGADAWTLVEASPGRRLWLERRIRVDGVISDVAMLLTSDGRTIPWAYTCRAASGLFVMVGEPLVDGDTPAHPLVNRARAAAGRSRHLTYAELRGAPVEIEPWWTSDEAAAYARVTVRTVERAAQNGELRSAGPSRRRRFKPRWIDAWLGLVIVMLLLTWLLLAVGVDIDLEGALDAFQAAIGLD